MTFPIPVDCLAGPKPTIPAMIGAEQDLNYYNSRCVSFDRQHLNAPAGSIPFIGDSITEGMALSSVTPYALNMGINGDTMRGVLNRLGRGGAGSVLHRAGAAVLMIGINDICYEKSNAYANCTFMWDLLSPWLTGKWVLVKVLPINENMFHSTTNATIKRINDYMYLRYMGRFPIVDVTEQLSLNGQLNPAYTLDGCHLNGAGYEVLAPAITEALGN